MLVRQSSLGLEPQCGRIDCISGEEALVYRHGYNGDVVAFKMGRRCALASADGIGPFPLLRLL